MKHTRILMILTVIIMTLGLAAAPVLDVEGYVMDPRPSTRAPAAPAEVLWDQPLSTDTQPWYSTAFTDIGDNSSYLADDFTNAAPWTISKIFVPGEMGVDSTTTLIDASLLTFMIFADNAGVPAGDPEGNGDAAVWELSVAPNNGQVAITAGSGGNMSNVTLSLTVPVELPIGHYWLVFYPTMEFAVDGEYGRQPSDTTNGGIGQFINPGGGRGVGNSWQDWTNLEDPMDPLPDDIAFRLEGTIGIAPDPILIYMPVLMR